MSDKPTFDHFGLSQDNLDRLLSKSLKPEEINVDAPQRHDRVTELLGWFARLTQGAANPKWLEAHAMELAYYIATNGVNRQIDLDVVRRDAYAEGVRASESDREILRKHTDMVFDTPLQPHDHAGRLDRLEIQMAQLREHMTAKLEQNG